MKRIGQDSIKEKEAELNKQELVVSTFAEDEGFGNISEWEDRYKHKSKMRIINSRSQSDDKFASTFSLVIKPNAGDPNSFTFKLTKEGSNLTCTATHYVWNSRQVI